MRILLQIEGTDTLPFIQWGGGVNAREGGEGKRPWALTVVDPGGKSS